MPTASLITGSSRYVRPALRVRASWTHLLRMTSSLAFANDARIRALPFTRFLCFKKTQKIPLTREAVGVFEKIKSDNDPAHIAKRRHPAKIAGGKIIGYCVYKISIDVFLYKKTLTEFYTRQCKILQVIKSTRIRYESFSCWDNNANLALVRRWAFSRPRIQFPLYSVDYGKII